MVPFQPSGVRQGWQHTLHGGEARVRQHCPAWIGGLHIAGRLHRGRRRHGLAVCGVLMLLLLLLLGWLLNDSPSLGRPAIQQARVACASRGSP